jgi:hypothetical protein
LTFVETATKPTNDEIKYIVSVNNVKKYYNGSAWVNSDGTYAQSNTAAEINTNAATLVSLGSNIIIRDLKHSNNGDTTPVLSNVKVTFNFSGDAPVLSEATIWGWYFDIAGVPRTTKTIKVQVTRWLFGTRLVTDDDYVDVTISSDGYFEVTLKYEDDIPTELKWLFDDYPIVTDFQAGTSRFKEIMR